MKLGFVTISQKIKASNLFFWIPVKISNQFNYSLGLKTRKIFSIAAPPLDGVGKYYKAQTADIALL